MWRRLQGRTKRIYDSYVNMLKECTRLKSLLHVKNCPLFQGLHLTSLGTGWWIERFKQEIECLVFEQKKINVIDVYFEDWVDH
jgi:hypothetical protein